MSRLLQPCRPTAILCDIGNTLLEERRFDLEAGLREVVMESDRIIEELAASFRQELAGCHERHRELLLVDWLGGTSARLLRGSCGDIEDRIWKKAVTLVPVPDVAGSLDQLQRHGVLLGALSNAYFSARVIVGEMEKHRLLHYFRFVLSSGDLGIRKPDPIIFQEGIQRAGRNAGEMWFVGDRYGEDVVGAISVGLQAVWMVAEDPATPPAPSVVIVRSWRDLISQYDEIYKRTNGE